VRLRDDGYACRVSVQGLESARQILTRLSGVFVFKTSEPMQRGLMPDGWVFRIPYGPGLSHGKLMTLLSAIPGVHLGVDLAKGEAG
jgi:hypothetical protein